MLGRFKLSQNTESRNKKAISTFLTSGKQKKDVQQTYFDYFAWWRACITQFNISPSEAWNLDYCELASLFELEQKPHQDASLMVNAQRELNGATP